MDCFGGVGYWIEVGGGFVYFDVGGLGGEDYCDE